MYAVMGATGQVGGVVTGALLAAGKPVRAVVHAALRGKSLRERGGEIAVAEAMSADALTRAFDEVERRAC